MRRFVEMFSERSSTAREPSELASALERLRARGEAIVDLGAPLPPDLRPDAGAVRAALAQAAALEDEPSPLGAPSARQAVSEELAREGAALDASRVVLTAGASESYASLFTLLCDPGDEVLVAQPSHPGLRRLADLAGVTLAGFPRSHEEGRWRIDAAELWEAVGERTRAIVLASPGVPTGAYLTREEAAALESFGLPLVVDERLVSYPLEAPADRVRAATLRETLCFALDGLSERAALPQMTLGWMTVSGPGAAVAEALERIARLRGEDVAVPTPAQLALPGLLASGVSAREVIRARCVANLGAWRETLGQVGVDVPTVEGGWSAPLRLPSTLSDEGWALALLERGVYVPPGSLYELDEREAWLVPSLVGPTEDTRRGAEALAALVSERGREG
jgi:alanine-synthesizing transaminase